MEEYKFYKISECPSTVAIMDCVENGFEQFRADGYKGKLLDEYSMFYDGADYYIAVDTESDLPMLEDMIKLYRINMGKTSIIEVEIK